MKNKTLNITEEEATAIISTLKEIKVRGFDSMDRLVGLVLFFQRKKESAMTDSGSVYIGCEKGTEEVK